MSEYCRRFQRLCISLFFSALYSSSVFSTERVLFQSISLEETQISCKVAADSTSQHAFEFGRIHEHITKNTKPNSKERSDATKEAISWSNQLLEKYELQWREVRQGTNIRDATFALIVISSIYSAMELALKHEGKSKEWYQMQIFDRCVSGIRIK